ncbi:MAG: hypothetical protein BGP09_24620 [Rhizobium sp. 60-20]|nr:MAG: hypothetical protein BGP09_24620 [Rhizobium sp. 60-20]
MLVRGAKLRFLSSNENVRQPLCYDRITYGCGLNEFTEPFHVIIENAAGAKAIDRPERIGGR